MYYGFSFLIKLYSSLIYSHSHGSFSMSFHYGEVQRRVESPIRISCKRDNPPSKQKAWSRTIQRILSCGDKITAHWDSEFDLGNKNFFGLFNDTKLFYFTKVTNHAHIEAVVHYGPLRTGVPWIMAERSRFRADAQLLIPFL